MKTFATLLLLIISTATFAQIKQFEPVVSDFPNLDPEYLLDFHKRSEAFYRILEENIPYEALTDKELEIYQDEMLFEAGPYTTEEMGCSWYCATGPKNIESSSALIPTKTYSYDAENVHDFDLRTAWVDGKSDYGIGEEITIDFELESFLKVSHMDIYNGYCKSEKTWKENSRVKVFALYVNGELYSYLNLEDSYKRQRFDLGSLGGNESKALQLTLKIIEVYKGDKYADTAISEINFDGTGDH